MEPWSKEKAWGWHAATPWIAGFNYVTGSAVNPTAMWQADGFDEVCVRRELGLARRYGYNSVRVFLPFVVWEKERGGFLGTFAKFADIAGGLGMSILPVLFDDCAFDPLGACEGTGFNGCREPFYGKQLGPRPGVSNSRWTPCPGAGIADDASKQPLLREYVHAVVEAFRDDARIVAWDVYNEAGNNARHTLSLPLLVSAFVWAREVCPSQPCTACVWQYDKDSVYHACLELSDIISCHDYLAADRSRRILEDLREAGRPILVTEWLCRPFGNTFETHLPLYRSEGIGCYQWGLIPGLTQTNLHWSTMFADGVPDPDPAVWQHDVLLPDGTPYRPQEMELLAGLLDAARRGG